jgi:hypothetical protein
MPEAQHPAGRPSEADEAAEVLSIGSVVGGATPRNAPWRDAIRNLAVGVKEARSGVQAPLCLNIVFHVPGNILKPEFSGTRTGTFSRRRALLMVQVALPDEPPPDADRYVISAAHAAISTAGGWAEQRGVDVDVSALHAILDRL